MSEDAKLPDAKSNLTGHPEPGVLVPPPADSAWWFTVAAYAVGILTIALAPALGGSTVWRVLMAIALMAASFVVVWVIRWIVSRCKRVWTRWVKGDHYDEVYEIAAANRRELDASQTLIRRVLSQQPSYSEISVSVFGGHVLLEFAKKGKRALPTVGTILSLFDFENGSVVGTFEVTTSDGKVCQARDSGDLEAIFAGFARTANARFLPDNMGLLTLPEEDGPNE